MFISVNCEDGFCSCFQIAQVDYNINGVLSINATALTVHSNGEIFLLKHGKVKSCELPTWSFLKYDGKPIGPMHEEELGEIEVRVNNSGSSAVTVQDLYHRLKRDLFLK